MMRILIVGGTSSLARALKPILAEFAEVITAGRSGCDVHLDLNDPVEQMVLPEGIDVVINTTASFGGSGFDEIFQSEQVNVLGVLKLCKACADAGVQHFISLSSASALLDRSSEYFGIYALSKRHADELMELYCPSVRLPYTILRPSQLYGEEDSFRRHQPFLYAAIDKAKMSEDINIYGSNDALRNYLYLDDFAQILTLVIQKRVTGLYSCLNEEDVSLSRIAYAAIKAFSSTSEVVFLKDKKDIPHNVFEYDPALYEKIEFFPRVSIEEGMNKIASSRKSKS